LAESLGVEPSGLLITDLHLSRVLHYRPARSPKIGSPGWVRTSDQMINSHLLYRLSYRGINLLSAAHLQDSNLPLLPKDRAAFLYIGGSYFAFVCM